MSYLSPAALAALLLAAPVSAATVNQSQTTSTVNQLGGIHDFQLAFAGFDPALGELMNVGVHVAFSAWAIGQVNSWEGAEGYAVTNWGVGLFNPDGSDLFFKAYTDESYVFAYQWSIGSYLNLVDDTGSAVPQPSTAPESYVSESDVVVSGSVFMGTVHPGYGAGTDAAHSMFLTTTLTYDYIPADDGVDTPPNPAPVPLPAGAPLALSAFAGLGWLGRRKRQQR